MLEAGCDEAGRGPLVGPVFAAAVILPEDFSHPLLNDSKQMTEKDRELLRGIIEKEAVAWAVEEVSAEEIDSINILNASITGMWRAVTRLHTRPESLIVDGNKFKGIDFLPETALNGVYKCGMAQNADSGKNVSRDGKQEREYEECRLKDIIQEWKDLPWKTFVKGDGRFASIAAASVLAKTYRDEYMRRMALEYPMYGWDRNMGYPTPEHIEAVRKYGYSPLHRKTFHVKELEATLF